jgi:nucleoside-diphosphate-sugar epimerase
MRLLVGVTGSSGFIGRHVATALASRGHDVMPVRRPFDPDALTGAFRGLDVVVNLAGVVSAARERDFESGNVAAARIVAHAARDAGVRLIHVSSLAAAGPAPPSAPRTENDPVAPITAYGRTKLAGEAAVREAAGLEWVILRPGVVYGSGDRALRPLFRYARRGLLPLVGDPDAAYTFIFIEDAVRAIVAAAERGAPGDTLFLGHDEPVTARALLEAIIDTLGTRTRIVAIPRAIVGAAAAAGDIAALITGRPATINARRFAELYSAGFVCRADRLRERLGIAAEVGLREGLRRSRDWYVA